MSPDGAFPANAPNDRCVVNLQVNNLVEEEDETPRTYESFLIPHADVVVKK
jgi:hypothetical protein